MNRNIQVVVDFKIKGSITGNEMALEKEEEEEDEIVKKVLKKEEGRKTLGYVVATSSILEAAGGGRRSMRGKAVMSQGRAQEDVHAPPEGLQPTLRTCWMPKQTCFRGASRPDLVCS